MEGRKECVRRTFLGIKQKSVKSLSSDIDERCASDDGTAWSVDTVQKRVNAVREVDRWTCSSN